MSSPATPPDDGGIPPDLWGIGQSTGAGHDHEGSDDADASGGDGESGVILHRLVAAGELAKRYKWWILGLVAAGGVALTGNYCLDRSREGDRAEAAERLRVQTPLRDIEVDLQVAVVNRHTLVVKLPPTSQMVKIDGCVSGHPATITNSSTQAGHGAIGRALLTVVGHNGKTLEYATDDIEQQDRSAQTVALPAHLQE